jgi:hypothetical protein
MMPPQKRSKKNIPADTDQEEHHHVEGNEISLAPEPSNITDQERRAKLEALLKARAKKTSHIQEQPTKQQTHEEDDDDDDETIDKTRKSSAENTAIAERKRKVCEPIASKKKGL